MPKLFINAVLSLILASSVYASSDQDESEKNMQAVSRAPEDASLKSKRGEVMKIFIGYDNRQPIGSYVFMHSVNKFCSEGVFQQLLNEDVLKKKELLPPTWAKEQLSTHGRSRFLVPYLSNFEGWSLFVDGADMMLRDDIAKLWSLRDEKYSVMVVVHPDFDRDFSILGRQHQPFPRFNQSSVMLFNNAKCKRLSAEYVYGAAYLDLHQFKWAETEADIGQLPRKWNHLVGFYPYEEDTALIHWTKGAPHLGGEFLEADYAKEWFSVAADMIGEPLKM